MESVEEAGGRRIYAVTTENLVRTTDERMNGAKVWRKLLDVNIKHFCVL